MFIFPFMPIPVVLILLIPIICMGLYYSFYIKLNNFESNKLKKIERQIMKITNVLLVYIIIMAIFRNDNVMKVWVGFFGINVSLVLFYICLLGAYLALREEKKIANSENMVDVFFINHKKGLYYLIGATIVMRFSFKSYISSPSTANLRMLIIFILLCLAQYELNKNLETYDNQKGNSLKNIIAKYSIQKNIILVILLVIIIGFTSGKVFLSDKEQKLQKNIMENQRMIHELIG